MPTTSQVQAANNIQPAIAQAQLAEVVFTFIFVFSGLFLFYFAYLEVAFIQSSILLFIRIATMCLFVALDFKVYIQLLFCRPSHCCSFPWCRFSSQATWFASVSSVTSFGSVVHKLGLHV